MNHCAVINSSGLGVDSNSHLFQCESIFGKSPLAQTCAELLSKLPNPAQSFFERVKILAGTLEVDSPLKPLLDEYISAVTNSQRIASPRARPNPRAGFWPDPTRNAKYSPENSLPFVEELGLIDRSTRIVSAGSCFASEIARELQMRYFNYIITESPHQPEEGVISSDFDPNKPLFPFSANWGLFFNTPSFRQLAEKAFEVKDTPHLLFEMPKTNPACFLDPFRQNVYFQSREAYEANYEKHRSAAREALLQADVFVLTFGLNECWELLQDGSVFATWPRFPSMLTHVRPKVLSYKENMQSMQSFIDLVRAHNPKVKFVISVSPIPFEFTVRLDQHVISANTHSKSMLRVVADELVSANKDVFYMPSYELVTRCISNPWEEDQRHVHRSTVERVMDLFSKMFVKSDDFDGLAHSPKPPPLEASKPI